MVAESDIDLGLEGVGVVGEEVALLLASFVVGVDVGGLGVVVLFLL